jgi:predicted NBD/HSP70 family sugar kinase
MDVYVALDIGGTKLMVAAIDPAGGILASLRAPTPRSPSEGLRLLSTMARECARGNRIRSIGASIGGPLNWRTGVVSPLHQPEWRGIPLKALMEREFGCPFQVDVDTNVAALGEWKARRGVPRRLLYLTLSTGMGGGFVVDGRLFRGASGEHPEVAHQAVSWRGPGRAPLCECGASGCLEERVSGNGIRRRFGKPAEELSSDEWAEVGRSLGEGLRNLATILVPDLIAVGGGVALGGGERLLGPARDAARSALKLVPFPPVELSALGYDTALRGALALALEGAGLLGD